MKKILLVATGITFLTNVHAQTVTEEVETTTEEVYEVEDINEVEYNSEENTTPEPANIREFKILKTIPGPMASGGTSDMEFDGKYLWMCGYDENAVHQFDPETGKIIKTIQTGIGTSYGIAFDGTYLWVVDTYDKQIHKYDPQTGERIGSVRTPSDPNESYPHGLTWDGKNFWHNDSKGSNIETSAHDSTFVLSPTGEKIRAYKAHGGYPTGIAFDGKYLWSNDNEHRVVHKINRETFEIVATFRAPGGQYPNGIATDGKYLWISNNETDMVYKVEIPQDEEELTNVNSVDTTILAQEIIYTYPDSILIENVDYVILGGRVDEVFEEDFIGQDATDEDADEEITEIPVGMLCKFIVPVVVKEELNDVIVNNTEPEVDFKNETPVLVAAEIIDATAYPNPTTGLVKFQLLTNEFMENTKVMVYDVAGKFIAEKTFEGMEVSIDLTPYDSGVFMYTIMSNGKTVKSGRLVKEGRR
ncbi:MAG TPA: T9SS type A sorting domain-containing protein [Flavobacteriales bacterium]|nr:T9SS type A sorting domain-containing protein [Flavobacteriales bacterium]